MANKVTSYEQYLKNKESNSSNTANATSKSTKVTSYEQYLSNKSVPASNTNATKLANKVTYTEPKQYANDGVNRFEDTPSSAVNSTKFDINPSEVKSVVGDNVRQKLLDLGSNNVEGYRDATKWDIFVNSFNKGRYDTEYSNEVLWNQLMGQDAPKKAELEAELDKDEYKFNTNGILQQGLSGAAQLLGQQVYNLTNPDTRNAALIGAGEFALGAGLIGNASPLVALPEEVVTVPTAAVVGFSKGMAVGSAEANLKAEAGGAYQEMKELGIDDSVAKPIALAIGGANAALEYAQMDKLLEAFAMASEGGASKTLLSAISKVIKEHAKEVAGETAQEVAQEFVTAEGVNVANRIDSGEWAYTKEEVLNRLAETGVSSAISFAFSLAPGTARKLAFTTIEQQVGKTEYEDAVNSMPLDTESKLEALATVSNEQNNTAQVNTPTETNNANTGDFVVLGMADTLGENGKADMVNAYNTVKDTVSQEDFTKEFVKAYNEGTNNSEAEYEDGSIAKIAYEAGKSDAETNNQLKEGLSYEGTNGSEERNANISGEERLESVSRRAAYREAQAKQRDRAKSIQYSVNAEKQVSSKSIGIVSGTDEATIRVVPKGKYTKAISKTVKMLNRFGYDTTVVVGDIKVLRSDGRETTVRGAVQGKHIYLRADHKSLSIEQIAMHELFHKMVEKDSTLINRMKQKIVDNYGEENLESLVRAYVEAYEWTSMTDEEILEEILADAYGGIDVFEYLEQYEGATKYSKVVNEEAKSVDATAVKNKAPPVKVDNQKLMDEIDFSEDSSVDVSDLSLASNGVFDNGTKFSAETYNKKYPKRRINITKNGYSVFDSEPMSGREAIEKCIEKYNDPKTSKAKKKSILKQLDDMVEYMKEADLRYTFVGLNNINNAKIVLRQEIGPDGEPVQRVLLSAMVTNGAYPVNFDLTKVCSRREPMTNFINELSSRAGLNGKETMLDEISLSVANLWKLNTILMEEGYDTACLGCFVESRRYNIENWAKKFINMYNSEVLKVNPNAEYFGFSKSDVEAEKEYSYNELTKFEEDAKEYLSNKENASLKKRAEQGDSKRLNTAEKIHEFVKLESSQKLLKIADLITEEGRTNLHQLSPDLESLVLINYGTNSPKSMEVFTPYNSEIELINDDVNGYKDLREYLKHIGGARSQSFSDFIITHVFDVMQKTAALSARDLPAHCYTKVEARVILFGKTGEKINMSVMFNIDPDGDWWNAGLDSNGDYIVGDEANARRYEAENDGKKTNIQSFPFELAKKIQYTKGYSGNCGIIGVGYSYNAMVKMFRDRDIRFIIGYHSSGLPKQIRRATNIDQAADYQPTQGTNIIKGFKFVKNWESVPIPTYATWMNGAKKTESYDTDRFSDLKKLYQEKISEGYDESQAGIEVVRDILEFCNENHLSISTVQDEKYHGSYNLYENLEETQDPKKTAGNFISWCIGERGVLPINYEFALEDNYYKILYDFDVYDAAEELNGKLVYAPQTGVRMEFPTEEDYKAIFGENPNSNNKGLMAIVDTYMDEYNTKKEGYAKNFEPTLNRIYKELNKDKSIRNAKFSEDSEGRKLSQGQIEYFKNSKARDEDGRLMTVYHGTDAEFTVFDRTKTRANMDIQGMFFSPYEMDSRGYGGNVKEYYLNITNPADESTAYSALNRFKGQNGAGIKAREYLVSKGYDGVYNGYDEYIAFYPEQIKLVDNLNPTDNEDIRYSEDIQSFRDLEDLNDKSVYTTGYENVPDSLMGFSKDSSKNKSFNESKYPYTLDLWVSVDEGESFFDESIKGMNRNHAIERARRNWADVPGVIIKEQSRLPRYSEDMWKKRMDVINSDDSLKSISDDLYYPHDTIQLSGREENKTYFERAIDTFKKYQDGSANKDNFFRNTVAIFNNRSRRPSGNPDYVSKNKRDGSVSSEYWYTEDGVIRGSSHWGMGIRSCDWALRYNDGDTVYGKDGGISNIGKVYGFASWEDFLYKPSIQFEIETNDEGSHLNGEVYVTSFKNPKIYYSPYEEIEAWSKYGTDNEKYSEDLVTDLKNDNDQLRKDLANAQATIKARTSQRDYWRIETTIPGKPRLNQTDVKNLSKSVIKDYSGTIDADSIQKKMDSLAYDVLFTNKTSYNDIKAAATDIASDIIKSSKELTSSDMQTYKDIKAIVKDGKGLYLSPQERSNIADWGKYRNASLAYVNISNTGTPVDSVYQDLANRFGEGMFPSDIMDPSEQLQKIVGVMQSLTPVFENPYSYDMAEATEYCANDIVRRIINGNIKELPPTRMEKAVKAEREKAAEAVAKEKAKREEQIEKLKQYYRDKEQLKRWDQAERGARQDLLKIAKRLEKLKTTEVNKALINQFIGELDTVSVSMTGTTVKRLKDLKAMYEDAKKNDPDFLADPIIEEKIARLEKKQISDMSIQDLLDLTDVLKNIENEIRTEKKLINEADRRDVYEQAVETMQNIDNQKGVGTKTYEKLIDAIVTESLDPAREIKRLTGYNESDPLYRVAKGLIEGQRVALDYKRKASMMFKKFTNDNKFMKSITGKEAKVVEIAGMSNGEFKTVKINRDMLLALYMHSFNDENLYHIEKGGITVPDLELLNKGDAEEAYARATTIKMAPGAVKAIKFELTDAEKEYVKVAKLYFNKVSKENINRVSEALKGYSLAQVENYFPINTNSNFTRAEFESIKQDGTIEGMGFLKERKHAGNPIYLRGLSTVLNQSVEIHSKYVGLAIPVRNFNKLWNVTSANYDVGESFTGSIPDSISRVWGTNASKYIEKIMSDIQGNNKKNSSSLLSKMRSNYAGAVLSLNFGVALKQAASYPTAAAVIGWDPLRKALTSKRSVNLDLVDRYTPLHWNRRGGYSTVELGDIAKRDTFMSKVMNIKVGDVPILNWIQGVDVATTKKLWTASEYYVEDTLGMEYGTEEFYKKTAEVYNQVIEQTQPNYTTMQRPQLLRSESEIIQNTIAMFKTQPLQNFGILYDAVGNYNAKKTAFTNDPSSVNKASMNAAELNLRRAATSQIVQLAVFSAMNLIYKTITGKLDNYKDKDGDINFLSVLKGIGKDMVSGAMSMVLFGSELYKIADKIVNGTYYDGIEVASLSTLNDTIDSVVYADKAIDSVIESILSGKDIDTDKLIKYGKKLAENISQIGGIPTKNVETIVESIYNNAKKVSDLL